MNKDKIIIELLIAILQGIGVLVLRNSDINCLKEANSYNRYVRSTIKLAEEYLEND